MDSQLVQRTRYQLQARVRTAKTCPVPLFGMTCGHLLDWIHGHPLLAAVVAPLRSSRDRFTGKINSNVAKVEANELPRITGNWTTETRMEGVALAFAALDVVRGLPIRNELDLIKMYAVAAAVAAYSPAHRRRPEAAAPP